MERLEEIRSGLGFTDIEVERAAGWCRGRLSEIERGHDLTDEEADVLTRLYGVDVEALVAGADGEAVHQPLAALRRLPIGRPVRRVQTDALVSLRLGGAQ